MDLRKWWTLLNDLNDLNCRLSKEAASSWLSLWLWTVPASCYPKPSTLHMIVKTCSSNNHSSKLVRVNDPKHQFARVVESWNGHFKKFRDLFECCIHPSVQLNFLRGLFASNIVHFGLKRLVSEKHGEWRKLDKSHERQGQDKRNPQRLDWIVTNTWNKRFELSMGISMSCRQQWAACVGSGGSFRNLGRRELVETALLRFKIIRRKI